MGASLPAQGKGDGAVGVSQTGTETGMAGEEIGKAFAEDVAGAIEIAAEKAPDGDAKSRRASLNGEIPGGAEVTAMDLGGRLAALRAASGRCSGPKQQGNPSSIEDDAIDG